jgi:ABC-type transport system substrate-binding protein
MELFCDGLGISKIHDSHGKAPSAAPPATRGRIRRAIGQKRAPGCARAFWVPGLPQSHPARNAASRFARRFRQGAQQDRASSDKFTARGIFNNGGYSNPRLDELISRIAVETNQATRQGLITEAGKVIQNDVGYIPLHQQQIVLAVRRGWNVVQTAEINPSSFALCAMGNSA